MATKLKIVGQYCQDLYEQNFRGSTSFFVLEDFVFNAAASAAAFYQALYEKEYARMRSDGQKDEVVAFSNDFLSTQILKIQTKDGGVFGKLEENVFSFAYDQSNVGVQNVFAFKPKPQYELERSDVDELWQLEYLPVTNKVFWALDSDRILLVNKGQCNIQEIKVLYVPQINSDNPETLLPDGIVKGVIEATVTMMKELNKNVVVKKTLDQNANKVIQSEIDKTAVQP